MKDVSQDDLQAIAEVTEARILEAVNDLDKLIVVAEGLADWYRERIKNSALAPNVWENGWGPALSYHDQTANTTPADTIEAAGVWGLYKWLSRQRDLNVLFVNDLAQERHGIDAVAHDRRRGRFLLLECKGTTIPLRRPRAYLKQTTRRGRQLSLQWCWASLVDFSCFAPTAPIFLRLVGPFLDGHCERALVVSRVEPVPGGFVPLDSQAYHEGDIDTALGKDYLHGFEKQKEWLAQIRAAGREI